MAISRVDPNATFRLISDQDDAIIHETAEELAELRAAGDETFTRYSRYAETLDEKILKFKEGAKPTYFVIRCLKNQEVAELQQKHIFVDPATKRIQFNNMNLAFLDYFNKGCLGMEDENGKLVKVSSEDVGLVVAIGIGSTISLFTSLGKNLKK